MRYGRIPEEVIEAVLKRHDIVDVIGRHVHLSKQGHYMKGLCPFHSEKVLHSRSRRKNRSIVVSGVM